MIEVAPIIDAPEVPYWQWRCLKELQVQSAVEISKIYVPDSKPESHNKSLATRLLNFYTRKVNRVPDFRPEDIRDYIAEDKIVSLQTSPGENGHTITAKEKKEIEQENHDVLLLLSRLAFNPEIDSLARHGAWLPSPLEQSICRGVPPGFWEIYQDQPATAVWLRRLGGEGEVLRTSSLKTKNDSYVRQLNRVVHEAMSLPRLCCQSLKNANDRSEVELKTPHGNQPPGLLHLLVFIFVLLKNRLKETYRRLFCREIWNIAVLRKPPAELMNNRVLNFEWNNEEMQKEFRADPFGVEFNGKLRIVYETLGEKQKGYLTATEFDGKWSTSEQKVLQKEFHLSYPFLLEKTGQYYCLPEQAENRRVAAYEFHPGELQLGEPRVLIDDVAAVDPTIFKYKNYWWLAFTDGIKGPSSWLHLWYADDIFETWQPHGLNPVKMDVRSARPAGTPFHHQGKLYRPAQDCSETYGGRVVFNEILELTPEKFKEQVVGQLSPDKAGDYPDGLHTISAVDGYTLVDGKKYVFDWNHFFTGCRKQMGI